MDSRSARQGGASVIIVGLAGFILLSGCAGRKVSTSVGDQTFVPGQPPTAEARPQVEEAKVAPSAPPPLEPVKQPRVEAPSPSAAVGEGRVTEQPIAPPGPALAPTPPPLAPALQPSPLADVFFDFDQFSIRSEARLALEANAGLLKTINGRTILIEGHCDERGTLAYNLILGERRARAVKQYLQDLGVPASQITITSFGKERPFCTGHSESCWQSNRRAHFAER